MHHGQVHPRPTSDCDVDEDELYELGRESFKDSASHDGPGVMFWCPGVRADGVYWGLDAQIGIYLH